MTEKHDVEVRREERQGRRGLQRAGREMTRWDPFEGGFGGSPFSLMRRMQEEMDRMFAGFGGRWLAPLGEERIDWTPAIDAFQRGNEFIIRADVPGLKKEDLTVEVGDDAVTIRGERKYDHEEEHEGIYRSERAFGSFYRVVPLPEGAVADSAKANFKDGVLEIVVQAPSQEVRRGRKIEISEASR